MTQNVLNGTYLGTKRSSQTLSSRDAFDDAMFNQGAFHGTSNILRFVLYASLYSASVEHELKIDSKIRLGKMTTEQNRNFNAFSGNVHICVRTHPISMIVIAGL